MLLEKLKAGAKNTRRTTFPGTDEEIVIRVLSVGMRQEAKIAAAAVMKKADIEFSPGTADLFDTERTTQMLFRAVRDIDGHPAANTVDAFRERITQTEQDALVAVYAELEAECSPPVDEMSDAEIGALWDSVKKNPSALSSVSSTDTLKRLVLFSAARPLS